MKRMNASGLMTDVDSDYTTAWHNSLLFAPESIQHVAERVKRAQSEAAVSGRSVAAE